MDANKIPKNFKSLKRKFKILRGYVKQVEDLICKSAPNSINVN